ncbi:MAG: hypothetical protein WA949_09735 [Phormidesmis sp.]
MKINQKILWLLLAGFLGVFGCTSTAPDATDTDATDTPSGNNPTLEPSGVEPEAICDEAGLVKQKGKNIFGVIEIGSSGVKSEVLQKLPSTESDGTFDLEPREENIEPRDVDPIDPTAQTATVAAVSEVFAEMQKQFAIPCEHIVLYGSSGFASKAHHKEALIKEIKTEIGRNVDLISEEEEAIYVFEAVVPSHRIDDVVMLDIGSGNTKSAYLDGNSIEAPRSTFSIDFGTKSFTKAVNDSKGEPDFTAAAEALKDEELAPAIQAVLASHPSVENKNRVYLAGGISWALTNLTRPCGIEQVITADDELPSKFSPLSAEDINTFYINVTRDPETLFSPDLSDCDAEKAEKVQEDIEIIRGKVFELEELEGGAEVLRALSSEMEFADKDAIFFSSYAIEALPLGYLKQQLN